MINATYHTDVGARPRKVSAVERVLWQAAIKTK
jgi:hypothetical protein